ncbi:MAG TPA: DUF1543 domain-containing protein [Flavobacterium sp.]|jgi:hypothetical protein
MNDRLKLFMLIIGCKPKGRLTEQHDVFFGIGRTLSDVIPELNQFWPDAGQIHIDSWREVTMVDGHSIEVTRTSQMGNEKLFFINLGGYKPGDMEEYHYKILTVAGSLSEATKTAKDSAFYQHCGFKGAASHIDDKYMIDVDDIYNVEEILPKEEQTKYYLKISAADASEDQLHIGYLKIKV